MSNGVHRQAAWTHYLDRGLPPAEQAEEGEVLRNILMEHDSYSDTRHRGHAQCTSDVKELYRRAYPQEQPAQPAQRNHANQLIQDIRGSAAYNDPAHAQHSQAKADLKASYEVLYRGVGTE